jgi:hypothetical protein
MSLSDSTVHVNGTDLGIGQALVEQDLRRGATRLYAGTSQPPARLRPVTPVPSTSPTLRRSSRPPGSSTPTMAL